MRRVLAVSGDDRLELLQGLVTNKVGDLPAWAALLTPQGKYLADFFVIPEGGRLLIDIDDRLADDLMRRLSMYKLRSKVDIAATDLQVFRGTGDMPDAAILDPRHQDLGWRLYGSEAGDDGSDWDQIRVEHTIPETLIELVPNETFILEAGFERLHGVDFRKGCYVGQEVTARMKHKTELKKGLVTLGIDGSAPVGTSILLPDGRAAGVLYTSSGDRAIAHMRFDRMVDGLTAGDARILA